MREKRKKKRERKERNVLGIEAGRTCGGKQYSLSVPQSKEAK